MKAIPVDIYDKDGNMLKIEFNDGAGNHVLDAIWDQNDAQTSENRVKFREWAYKMLQNKGYEVPS
jgi:hypothetical protein